jgi:hypothetical protein
MEDNTNSLDKAAKEYVQAWTEAVTEMWESWMSLMGLVEAPNKTNVQSNANLLSTDENNPQQSHNLVADMSFKEVPTTKNLPPFPLQLKDKDSIIRELKEQLAIQQETIEQQGKTIAKLEQQLAELQSVASIGSRQLNNWRSRVF